MNTFNTTKKMENKNNNKIKLVTHNGSFHADDIFACATLSIMLESEGREFEVIRTRDEGIINTGDYVFDVGSVYDASINRFDHHQMGGAGARENTIPYSSFGLIWKHYGEKIAGSPKAQMMIDKNLVQPVDAFDNGVSLVDKKGEIVPYFIQHAFLSMCPTWIEEKDKSDEYFSKSVSFAKEILKREIIQVNAIIEAEDKVVEIYNNTEDKRIIILDKKYPYEEILGRFKEPLYAVFPRMDDTGHWSVKGVRAEAKSFINRKDFPKSWAGLQNEELAKVTGVEDAVFCHRAMFLAVAKSKAGAIKLAELALNS